MLGCVGYWDEVREYNCQTHTRVELPEICADKVAIKESLLLTVRPMCLNCDWLAGENDFDSQPLWISHSAYRGSISYAARNSPPLPPPLHFPTRKMCRDNRNERLK